MEMKRILGLWPALLAAMAAVSPARAEFSIDDYLARIQSESALDVDRAVELLPEEMKSFWVLVYKSRSRHSGANATEPRVLLSTPDSTFIVSVAGGPDQVNANAVEVVQFRTDTKQFEFREILLTPGGPRPYQVSTANPGMCHRCHGVPARPLWDGHDLVPGVYGGRRRDQIFRGTLEDRNFRSLLASNPAQKPLFRHLRGLRSDVPDTESYSPGASEQNTRFSANLARLTVEAFITHLRGNEGWRPYEAATKAAIWSCANLKDYLPAELRSKWDDEAEWYHEGTLERVRNELTIRVARYNSLNHGMDMPSLIPGPPGEARDFDPEPLYLGYSEALVRPLASLWWVMDQANINLQTSINVPRDETRALGWDGDRTTLVERFKGLLAAPDGCQPGSPY